MDKNALIAGFIGSLIGIFLSGTYGRITTAFKLNRIRKILVNCFQAISIPKCEKYIEDINLCIEFVENFSTQKTEKEKDDETLDYMPMFNSDILKSINPELLLQTSFKAKTHSELIEITYTIDFLKKNMSIDKMTSFKEKVIEHLKEKKIENGEFYKHLLTCSFYKNFREQVLSDLNLKIATAEGLNKEQKVVVKDLKGNSLIWILKYIWRQ